MAQFSDEIQKSVSLLRSRGIIIEQGLSNKELIDCEERYGFRFPPDLREFLQCAFPLGQAFPNWRSGDDAILRERLDWPFEGMAFDIEHNTFWLDEWGIKPSSLPEALEVARRTFEKAPKLIPVYAHRYLPDEPRLAGNPILSVHQTDIIYYGQNLWDYFEQEFGQHKEGWYAGQRYANWTPEEHNIAHRPIRFWSGIVS
jgi:hypothetical protein